MVVLLYHYRLPGTVPVQYDTVYYVLLITRVLYCVLSLYRTSTVQVPYKYKLKNGKMTKIIYFMFSCTHRRISQKEAAAAAVARGGRK